MNDRDPDPGIECGLTVLERIVNDDIYSIGDDRKIIQNIGYLCCFDERNGIPVTGNCFKQKGGIHTHRIRICSKFV